MKPRLYILITWRDGTTSLDHGGWQKDGITVAFTNARHSSISLNQWLVAQAEKLAAAVEAEIRWRWNRRQRIREGRVFF